ncbi:MAG: type II secretion system F family protein [Planctomycetota bacterium]|nr:MAG: type II secretion system F family protein [Planctomycetota bacterium]
MIGRKLTVAEKKKSLNPQKIKLTPRQLIFFNNQLSSMVKLDLSIPAGLRSLAKEVSDPQFRFLIEEIEKDLSQGVSLIESMRKFPNAFPPLYIEILKAGESTGNLATVLYQLTKYSETMFRIQNRIKDALSYPLFVLFASIVLVLYMLLIAIPEFKRLIVVTRKGHYPLLTKIVFYLSDLALNPTISIPFLILFGCLFILLWRKTQTAITKGKEVIFHFPLFGTLFQKAALLKICRTMSDLLRNGVSMVESLALSSDVAGDNNYKKTLQEMKVAVENGERMSSKLSEQKLFPETMVWKLQMAEERGILEEALEELAFQFEEELELTASFIMRIIEPLLLLFIAIIIGTLVLALYLPLFQSYH